MDAVALNEKLVDFIKAEMKERGGLSITQFAKELGVATATVGNILRGVTEDPKISFFRKLAKYTGTPINRLLALAYPDVADEIYTIPPDVLLLATRLNALPQPIRDVVMRLVKEEE